MSNNINYSRLIPMHGTKAELDPTFTPAEGEIVVYDPGDGYNYSRFKVGDGDKTLAELEFSSGAEIKDGTTILKAPLNVVDVNGDIVANIEDTDLIIQGSHIKATTDELSNQITIINNKQENLLSSIIVDNEKKLFYYGQCFIMLD